MPTRSARIARRGRLPACLLPRVRAEPPAALTPRRAYSGAARPGNPAQAKSPGSARRAGSAAVGVHFAPLRRSHTRSQCRALWFTPPVTAYADPAPCAPCRHLLVQQRVERRKPHRLVEPERELAQDPRTLVRASAARRNLRRSRLGLDAAPGLEAQPSALDPLTAPGGRHPERHDAFRRILAGAREDLAVGQVVTPGSADPAAAADTHAQIGAFGHDAQFVDLLELRDQAILALALLAPGDDRVGLVEL